MTGAARMAFVGFVLLGAVCAQPWAGAGQGPAAEVDTAGLEARLAALEALLADRSGVAPCWEDVSDERFSVHVGGRFMGDMVLFPHQDAESRAVYGDMENYFEFRRLRLAMEGEGYGVFDYECQLEFEPEERAVMLKDVWAGVHEIPLLGYVRFGWLKQPFALDEWTSSKYTTFLERALPVHVWAPAERTGICAFGHSPAETVTWGYGAFFDDVDELLHERVSDNQGVGAVVRCTWNPVYEADGRGVLHLGAAYTYRDDADDLVRFDVRPEIHEGVKLLDTGPFPAYAYHVVGTETAAIYGPASVQGELFATWVEGSRGQADMEFYGAYLFASYFLTGENRVYERTRATFGRVRPITNFWVVPTARGTSLGWGAWELTARWSYLDLSDSALSSRLRGQMHDLTLGVNWYWNPHTRMMLNWIHAWTALPELATTTGTDVLAMRFQIDF